MEVDALSAALAGSRLADYEVLRKIGGKDVTPGGMAATATMHGVCSYVYTVRSRRAAAAGAGERGRRTADRFRIYYLLTRTPRGSDPARIP